MEWQFNVSNNGERNWSGDLSCTFSGSLVLNQSLSITEGSNDVVNVTLTARPGSLDCALLDDVRIHDDSTDTFTHLYDMDAAHFSGAGSAGLTVEGSNFHVGDLLTASLIVHNGGDLAGSARLQLSDGGGIADGPSRQFEVGHSLQLTATLSLSSGSGVKQVQWAVVSENGLVDSNLTGVVQVQVSPPQRVDVSIDSNTWDAGDGLSTQLSLTLSDGRTRTIHLIVGHAEGVSNVTVVETDITLSPGQRTLNYTLGHPDSADSVWATISTDGWTALFVSQLESIRTVATPDLTPVVTLGVATPAVPSAGDSVTIAYTLSNEGTDATTEGVLALVLSSTNEVIWTADSPTVFGGDSESGTIDIDSWPAGAAHRLSRPDLPPGFLVRRHSMGGGQSNFRGVGLDGGWQRVPCPP